MKLFNQTFIVLHIKPPNRIMNQTQEKIKKNLMAD
jgi:hypothetical protein